MAGDVAGTTDQNRIEKLQNKTVKADSPANKQVLTFSQPDASQEGVWIPADVAPAVPALPLTGDVSGTTDNNKIA